ncbi:hypothetical protein BDV06DRAFT_214720 [Aspergillus oleicola]
MENSSGLDSTGLTLVALTVLFFGISILALVMRLWARKIKRAPVGLDDWLMVASVVLLSGVCANILAGVYTYGGGQVYADPEVSRRKMVIYLQSFYSLPPLYATNITPVKLSVLFLYRRIFPTPDVQRPCTLLIVICLIWWVIAIIGDLLYCIPMRHYWDPTEEGHCFDFPTFFLVMTIADMLIDVAIFATPMPTIRKLHMPLRKRLGVAGILLLGALFVLSTHLHFNRTDKA